MYITIDYEPTPKGVPRVKYVNGQVITYYHWKTTQALEAIRKLINDMNLEPFPPHIPLSLTVSFFRTKSRWLPKKETMPFRKCDLDNLLKLSLDTLTGTIVPDDAQFTSIYAKKRWSDKSYGYITIEIEGDAL